jgi:hypothetical protein
MPAQGDAKRHPDCRRGGSRRQDEHSPLIEAAARCSGPIAPLAGRGAIELGNSER